MNWFSIFLFHFVQDAFLEHILYKLPAHIFLVYQSQKDSLSIKPSWLPLHVFGLCWRIQTRFQSSFPLSSLCRIAFKITGLYFCCIFSPTFFLSCLLDALLFWSLCTCIIHRSSMLAIKRSNCWSQHSDVLSKSSSSSCRAGSMDIPGLLSPLFPIVHRLRQVFWTTSRILT